MSEILNLAALCRCCHADGDFRSLQAPYVHDGAIEIYAVMLRDALGVHINPPTIEASYTICEGCIEQLRLALKFKKQVLACEKTFEEYCKNEQHKHTSTSSLVKMEIEYDNALSPDVENNYDNYDDDDDDDVDDSDGGFTEADKKTKGNKKQEQNGPVTCKFCKEMFTNIRSLRTHILSHIVDTDGATCKYCKITFKPQGLYRHLSKHENMECSFCTEVFLSVEELKTHEHSHIELTGYVCNYCKMGFKNKVTLAKHMKLHEEDYYKCVCDWCGRAFNMAHNLRQHISAVHRKLKPFQCDQCQKHFSTKAILSNHYKSHTGERPVGCPSCPKRFKTVGELNAHTDKHHRNDERDDDVRNNDGDDDGGDGKVVSDDDGDGDSDGGYDLNNDSDKGMEGYDLNSESDKGMEDEKGQVEIKLEEETKPHDVKIKECIDDDDDDDYTNNDVSNEYEDAIEDDKEIEEIKPEKVYVKPETKRKGRKTKTGNKIGHSALPLRYSCVICNDTLPSKPKLRSHVQSKHTPQDSPGFTCPPCNITFRARSTFISHMKLLHEKPEYHCYFCTDTFPTFKGLNSHKKSHNTEAICDYCQKSFKNKHTLVKHIRLHTGNYKEYVCETCGMVTKSATNLKVHIRSVHEKLRPFKCDQCPKTYTEKKHLVEHVRIHTGERPFECPVCFKRFRCKNHFNVHKDVHTKSDGANAKRRSKATTSIDPERLKNQCDTCGKTFANKFHLKSHMNVHTKPFNCDVCGKRFGYKHLLDRHQKKSHDGKPTEGFCRGAGVCKICNKNYYNWEIHKRVHEKKPFSCHLCHKIYTEQKTLDWHMNVKHLKDRKYVCQFCQKDFTRLDALKTHLFRKHDSSRVRKKKEKKSKCQKTETQQPPVKVEAEEGDFDSVLPAYAVNMNELGPSDYDYSSVRDAQDVLGI